MAAALRAAAARRNDQGTALRAALAAAAARRQAQS